MGLFTFLREAHERHERLKHRVHSFRLPLSPTGRLIMSCVYFSTPIVLGYFIMQATNRRAEVNVGPNGANMNSDPLRAKAIHEQNQGLQAILDMAKERKEGKKP